MKPTSYFRLLASIALLVPVLAHGAASGDDLLATPPAAETPPAVEPAPAGGDAEGALADQERAKLRATALAREGLEQVRRFNQDQVHNSTAIVDAAISFGKAREQFVKGGADADAIAEVQANLYWCKKQMNLDALKDYVAHKGDEFKLASQQMEAVVAEKVDPSQAGAYLARAEKYAAANATDYLQIAIRFTEVAERFPGAPEGTTANKGAAAAVQAQMKAIQDAALEARQTRFTKPKSVVAGATAVPGAQDQKDALGQIRKTFAKNYAKKDAPAKARLARKLLEETAKNRADPVAFYVLTSETIRLASEAEAYEPLLDGIELLASTFAGIDATAEKQVALKKMSGKAVAGAIAKLLTDPTDAAANLTAGKWFCLVAHRWSDGLPMLALGADPEMVKIAGMEISAPQASNEQLQLADAWYDVAGKQRAKDDKIGMLGRAMFWYQLAFPQMAGLAKDRVAKRITEIDKLLPLDLDNVDWNALTAGQWDKLKGRMATINARVDRFDPAISLAAGESVRVVPHPTEQWSIVLDAWTNSDGKKTSCGWRGYGGQTYFYYGSRFRLGALLAWVESGEKQNAGIIRGPGRVYFSPYIGDWGTGDRSGTIRVKLIPVVDD